MTPFVDSSLFQPRIHGLFRQSGSDWDGMKTKLQAKRPVFAVILPKLAMKMLTRPGRLSKSEHADTPDPRGSTSTTVIHSSISCLLSLLHVHFLWLSFLFVLWARFSIHCHNVLQLDLLHGSHETTTNSQEVTSSQSLRRLQSGLDCQEVWQTAAISTWFSDVPRTQCEVRKG